MANRDCEICQGRGRVYLPRYPRVLASYSPADGPIAPVSSKPIDYPCPECSDTIPVERLGVIKAVSSHCHPVDDAAFRKHVLESAAYKMIDELLKSGHIILDDIPETATDRQQMIRRISATIGVVSAKAVATVEQRAFRAGRSLAHDVVESFVDKIRHFNGNYVSKEEAIRCIHGTLRLEIEKAEKMVGLSSEQS
jgi:hypothetical protein